MTAYLLADTTIVDAAAYEIYKTMVRKSLEAYGGRFVIRGGPFEVLEGDWSPTRLVMIAFDSAAQAKAWLASPEYAAAKTIRLSAAKTNLVLVEGL
jgi:uncharacterized protein (DUF1330 family)